MTSGLLIFIAWQTPVHATLISLETSTTNPAHNSVFSIDIWARNLGTDIVSGFDIDIHFDSNALVFQSASFSSLLGDGIDSLQDALLQGSVINLAELSFLFEDQLNALQNGTDFILGSLTFAASELGSTAISLSDAFVTGADLFAPTFSGPGNTLTVEVSPSQVPEPATWLLVLFAWFTWRLLIKNSQLQG